MLAFVEPTQETRDDMRNALKKTLFAGICAVALCLVQSQPAYADLRLIVTDSAGGTSFDSTFPCSPNCNNTGWGTSGTITLTNYTIDFTTTQELQNSGAALLNFTG